MPYEDDLTEVRTTGVPGLARRNRWRDAMIDLPADWQPHRTVSVVIPAFNAADTLDLTLASLARQDYPAHLVEVVVVDDGSTVPYTLPEIHPENTRVVTPETGWGRANACHTGVLSSSGEIIVWLDSDIIVPADHLTAHLRWHDRVRDVATKGDIRFVDTWDVTPSDIAELSGSPALADRLEKDGTRSQWVESTYQRTDDLNTDSPYIFTIYTGASGSVSRDLYMAAGGMDTSLRLGEDSDLSYRLAARGAVFMPARDAVAWHLGPTNVERRVKDVNSHDKPYLAQRAPLIRGKRTTGGRTWSVPMVHAVVTTDARTAALARECVDRLLTSTFTDLRVSVVAPWDTLTAGRYRPLDAEDRELRLLQEWLRDEPRVRLTTSDPGDPFPAAFRLDVPCHAGLGHRTVAKLVALASEHEVGLVRLPVADSVVSLVRTAALSRATRNLPDNEDLQTKIDRVWGIWWAHLEHSDDVDLREHEPAPQLLGAAEREEKLVKALQAAERKLATSKQAAARPDVFPGAPPAGYRANLKEIKVALRGIVAETRRRLTKRR